MVTFETLAKEVRDRVASGEDAGSILKSIEGKALEHANEGIAENLADIQASVCDFLNAPTNLHKYFIAQFEELLLRTDTRRYERFILSMLLNVLNDPEAVRSAAELVAEIENHQADRKPT